MKNKKKGGQPIIKKILSSRRIFTFLAVCCGISVILGAAMTAAAFISYHNDEETFRELAEAAQIRCDEKERAEEEQYTVSESDENNTQEITAEKASAGTAGAQSSAANSAASEPAQVNLSSLKKLMAQNSECIGWLKISGTNLDYPVMHTPDEPLKYINRNFYGKKSAAGVPFLDGRCDLVNSDNLIIYGHRMKNGTMFSCLKKYTGEKYYAKHPEIELTLSDGKHTFRIFAVVTTTKTDNWYRYTKYLGEDEFNSVVDEILTRSLYSTGLQPKYGTRLISLSSCYGSGKNGRIIVIGMED